MLEARLDVEFTSSGYFVDPSKDDPRTQLLSRKMQLFDPVRLMVADAFKNKKKRMISEPKLDTCLIMLTKEPSTAANIGLVRLTADVFFDLEELLNLPNDENISGPYVVEKFRSALPLFEETQLVDTETIKQAADAFEADGYRYRWIMKNSKLGKRDFRVKLEVTECPGHDSVWAEVTSERLGIFERFEVFHQEKFKGRPRGMFPEWTGEYTRHGGMYNTRHVSLTSEGLNFGSDDAFCFKATFNRSQLSTELCDTLGIAE